MLNEDMTMSGQVANVKKEIGIINLWTCMAKGYHLHDVAPALLIADATSLSRVGVEGTFE